MIPFFFLVSRLEVKTDKLRVTMTNSQMKNLDHSKQKEESAVSCESLSLYVLKSFHITGITYSTCILVYRH